VLSIGKLGAGKADYYLKSVAQGIEDYYTGAGEAPGWWTGSAADEMEVFGQVEGELLHRALAGQHPKTGGQLAHAGAIRVPGYDLTFSAPKSVSLLFGLGGADVAREVREAHDAAVQAALGYMERQCAVGRRGRGGTLSVMGNGFLAAAFRHRTSRAGDPQLHTHVLVSNMTRGPDGRWTALDARRLYAHAKTGGCLYQAQLRAELTRRLGVQWTQVRNGQAEIAGFASQVLRGFSRRRSEVKERMEQRGERSSKAAEMAALDTRRAKDYSVDSQALTDGWAVRAKQLGLDPADLVACLSRVQAHALDEQQAEQVQDRLAGPDGLTAHQSSFTRRDVIRAWCEQLQEGADVGMIEELADEFLRSDRVVPLLTDAQGLAGTDVIRRQDGRIVPSAPEGRSYSTPELLQIERTTIDRAVSSAKAHVGVVGAAIVRAAIERRPTLSDEQVAMVRSLCLDGNGVQVIVGKGGTGKTFAMDAAREAWQAGGYRVIGAALARRAAYELRDGAGIESTSVTALLAELRNDASDETGVLETGRAVLVIDEAGMVGTRQLAEIISFAEAAQAKVVLLGDTHQLPEIHAGGLFRGLAVRLTPIILTENRRQHEAWERQALDLLRHGQAEQALSRYQQHGRLVIEDSADGVRQRMVADWWQAREEGTDTVMIALRRDDVRDLNGRARALMAATGRLGGESIEIAGRDFAVGDEIVTLTNNRRLDVLNGTRATVVGVHVDRRQLHIHTTDDREVTLPSDYLESPDDSPGKARVDHAYAITGHKAQGMTTGTVLVLGTEDLYREWGYTALSRGQRNNRLYLTLPEPSEREEFAPSDSSPRGPFQRTVAALQRSRAQVLAIDAAYAQQLADTPTRELLQDFDRLHARIASAGGGIGKHHRLDELERQRQAAERTAEDAQARVQALQAENPRERSMDIARETAAAQQARERAEALREQAQALAGTEAAASPLADDMERYVALRSELSRRREGHGYVLALEPPTYLTEALGSVPERIGARKRWKRLAVEIESYRQRYAIDDQSHALGPQPTDLRQRAAWRELHERVDRLERSLDSPQRDVGRSVDR
jgi:conjugative relaxase-like TrwC/TraI family protein